MWFANGSTGVSSEAMACAVNCLNYKRGWGSTHPHDPADFNRCLLFLEAVPEAKDLMYRVAAISEVWARLVTRWSEIESSLLEEVGLNWEKGKYLKATRTYSLMKQIINDQDE